MIVDPNEPFMRDLMSTFHLYAFESEKADKDIWRDAISHQVRYHRLSPIHAALLENHVPQRNTPYTREQAIEAFHAYIIEDKRKVAEDPDFYKNYKPDIEDLFSFYCEDLYYEGRVSHDFASMDFELTEDENQLFKDKYDL